MSKAPPIYVIIKAAITACSSGFSFRRVTSGFQVMIPSGMGLAEIAQLAVAQGVVNRSRSRRFASRLAMTDVHSTAGRRSQAPVISVIRKAPVRGARTVPEKSPAMHRMTRRVV